MVKPLEIALIGVGGLSLFSVCFVGFASVTGVPMHTLPLVGALYEEPTVVEDGPEAPVPDPTDPEAIMPRPTLSQSDRKVIEESIASLSSWSLQPPFEIEELGRLVAELRDGRAELERREQEVEAREAQLAEELLSLGQRGAVLDELRTSLEQREATLAKERAELERLAGELNRTDLVQDDARDKELIAKSLFFAEGDAEEAAQRLTRFPAPEAAAILHKLGDSARAIEILNAVPQDSWQEYMTAYAQLGS